MYINITLFLGVKLENVLVKYRCFAGNFCFFLHIREITYALKKQAANYFHYIKIEFRKHHKSLATYTYLLISWCSFLLEKLTGFELAKKFPAFYVTRMFNTAFTNSRLLSLS
jgi:hypothetical protein